MVVSNWLKVPAADEYMKYMIEHNQHVAVETESGELVGWMFERTFGALGILHTMETHRRKGLGRYLTIRLIELMLAMDKPIFMHVNTNNTTSLKLAESCGFKVFNDQSQDHEHIFIIFAKKDKE